MLLLKGLAALQLVSVAAAQVTFTGCHNDSSVEYCYGPGGEETAVSTYPAQAQSTMITSTLPESSPPSIATTGQTTAVTECHSHESEIECVNGNGQMVLVSLTATPTGEPPAQYTECHAHGDEAFCVDPSGDDVLVVPQGAGAQTESEQHSDNDGHDHADGGSHQDEQSQGEMDCHFHAGVEHCVPVGQSESTDSTPSCGLVTRDYDVPLRIGSLFIVLVTSSIAVFAPIVLAKLPLIAVNGPVFTVVKQFGTGVIIAVAFVHLYTHAHLMFANECLGTLAYEATTSALVMAGIFLTFLVEYTGHRIVLAKGASRTHQPSPSATSSDSAKGDDQRTCAAPANTLANLGHNHGSPFDPTNPNSKVSVLVMEVGVIFHSVIIGLTLVVAGDSFYRTLLVVIVFHQFFEGLALGARIALLTGSSIWPGKFFMGLAFALVTPLGMAIGLGVLNSFNGNDASTVVAIGTLDAVSAGILVWVGVVDMWARDWVINGGELVDASMARVLFAGFAFVAGLVSMSALGKWA